MMLFKEYDMVRVKQLIIQDRWWTGSAEVKRPPAIGDCATIVDIPKGSDSWLTTECIDKNGQTIWVADFIIEELELFEETP